MLYDWSARIAAIGAAGAPGTVLHIGAGAGASARPALAAGAAAVVLTEPDPVHRPALEALAAADARVQVLPVAIAAAGGEAPYFRTTVPGTSGLRDPAPLAALFPGLRVAARPVVPTLAAGDLVHRVPLAEGGNNVLILEAAGEEAAVIDALAAAGALERFAHVLMRAGAEALLAGTEPAGRLVARLAAAGFRLAAEDRGDPDFPALHLALDPLVPANRRLTAALAEARAQLEARDKALAEARAQAEAKDKALAEARAQAEARDKAVAEARAQVEAKAAALAEAQAQCDTARGHAALALQMQALRDGDLRDLQARHGRLVAENARKTALIEALTERLAVAARYLDEDGVVRQVEPQPAVPAIAPEKAKKGRKRPSEGQRP